MKKAKTNVVIVGAGFFGTKRLEACLSLKDDFTVIGIVETSKDRQKQLEKNYAIPISETIDAFNNKAQLAIIATPNLYHEQAAITAIKHNLHVLCEKPLTTSTHSARKIVHAAQKQKVLIKTGSNHRFFHTIQKAKELYDEGAIGKILFFKGSIGTNGTRVSKQWFWDAHIAGGGTFIDNGCHVLDLARMFMGDFTRVSASMTTSHWKQTKVEDIGAAMFVTKDNRQAIITSSWVQWAGYLHIELWGNKGYIIVDSTTHDTVTIGGKDGTFVTYDYSNEPKDSYHRELLYLKDCIDKNIQPAPSAADGYEVINMITKAYESSKKQTWIHI